jgi:hypothetical protein
LINYGTKVDIYSLNKKDLSSFFLLNLIGLLLCSQFEQNENSKKWKKLVLLYHIDIYIVMFYIIKFGVFLLPDLARFRYRIWQNGYSDFYHVKVSDLHFIQSISLSTAGLPYKLSSRRIG